MQHPPQGPLPPGAHAHPFPHPHPYPHPHPAAPPRSPKKGVSPVLVALLVGVVLIPVALVATCVGMLVLGGSQSLERADHTLRACGPGGDDVECGEVTGTSDDEATRQRIQAAVAAMIEDLGAYVSMSPRGTCSHHSDRGSVQELSTQVELERRSMQMLFRWENDVLVGFIESDDPPDCD